MLEHCFIGPLEQASLDLCLQRAFPRAHFFTQADFEQGLQAHELHALILIEPLQRPIPDAVWRAKLPRIGLGSVPAAMSVTETSAVQRVLASLDAFIPLEDQIRAVLPSTLPVSETTVWNLGLQHFAQDAPVIYPVMAVLQSAWSESLPLYEGLKPEVAYFIQVNPIRLPFFLQRSSVALIDQPEPCSLHFQALASGAQLLVPEQCARHLSAYLEVGKDFHSFTAGSLQDSLDLALQNRCDLDLQRFCLSETLPRALEELAVLNLGPAEPQELNLERQAEQLSLSHTASGFWGLKQLLPQLDPDLRLRFSAYYYLSLLNSPSAEGRLIEIQQRSWKSIQGLPAGLYQDVSAFYWAYLVKDYPRALASVNQCLSALVSEIGMDAPEAWSLDPFYLEIRLLGYGAESLEIWLRFCRCFCLAHLQELDTARAELKTLLQSHYFPAGLQLWLAIHGQKPPLDEVTTWLQKHPQLLDLAIVFLRQLGAEDKKAALRKVDYYVGMCRRVVTQMNDLERLMQVQRELRPELLDSERDYVLWEGPLYAYSSLASINRRWLEALDAEGEYVLSHIPFEPPELPMDLERRRWEQIYTSRPDVYVSHRWPPRENPPQAGKWVGIIPWEFGVIPESWVKRINTLQDEIWMPSVFVAQSFAISGVDPARLRVIPNGVETDVYCPEGPGYTLKTDKRIKLIFVGGTIFRKGFDLLLKAYQEAFTALDDVVLVVKSFGSSSQYALLSQDLERSDALAPELLLIDADLSTEEMAALYRACDIYVHPYRGEGFGMPILEAMACGLPVVIPNAGPAPEFCSPEASWQVATRIRFEANCDVQGLGAALSNPYYTEVDLPELVRTLKAAVANPALCRQKGLQAHQEAQVYDWQRIFTQVKTALSELVQRPYAYREREAWIQTQLLACGNESDLEAAFKQAPDSGALLAAVSRHASLQQLQFFWRQALRAGLPLEQALPMASSNRQLGLWPGLPVRVTVHNQALILPALRPGPRLMLSPHQQATIAGDLRLCMGLPDAAPPASAVQYEADITYLLASDFPSILPSGELWLAHPRLLELAEAGGKTRAELFCLPLAVDFAHFHPEQAATVLPESEGRFVFLSIFDWTEDGAWQDLLQAYFQAFDANAAVSLVLKPYGADFDIMIETLMAWLEEAGFDPENVPELSFVQEDLKIETLPGLYTGADCFVTAHGQGNGIWHLAAQASGVPVISCGQFPFLERPFSELFRAGDLSHLAWLMRQHHRDLPVCNGLIVRNYLQPNYDAKIWQTRAEERLIRSRLYRHASSGE